MAEIPPFARLLAGFDYSMGRAVSMLLKYSKAEGLEAQENLLSVAESFLGQAIALKTERKAAVVPTAVRELRHVFIEAGVGKLEMDVLNIVESYAAGVCARKLRDLIREEIFSLRQVSFGDNTGTIRAGDEK